MHPYAAFVWFGTKFKVRQNGLEQQELQRKPPREGSGYDFCSGGYSIRWSFESISLSSSRWEFRDKGN